MKTVIFPAALFAAQSVMAAAPINGWYASVFGGYTYLPPNVSISSYGLTRTNSSYDNGYNAGGRFGYQSYPLRYEAEVAYLHADLNEFDINTLPQNQVEGHNAAATAMVNVYYDFPEMVPAIMPFLGIGLGYGWVDGLLTSNGPITTLYGPAVYTRYEANNSVLAYQVTAGVTYNFSENYAANLTYRYLGTDRVDGLGQIFQAHSASLGIIYRFDDSNYK
jgi:opacity protein-like surface antigen